MNCAHCGELLTGDIKFCPSCGTPVPADPQKTTEEYEAALESAALPPEKTTEEYEAELKTAVVEAAPKEEPVKKKRRFRIPLWPFVTILLLAGVYWLATSMFQRVTHQVPTIQGAGSCQALAETYLDVLADTDEGGRLAALMACALPAAEGEDYWTITDSCAAPVGKEALSATLGEITFSDLEANAANAAALEEFCGREVEEVLLVPVTVFYADGDSADFTMELVQLAEGYFLLEVR